MRLRRQTRGVAETLMKASDSPAWLGWDELVALQDEYPHEPGHGYDPRAREKRGEERAQELMGLTQRLSGNMDRLLELGCGDGMASCAMQQRGKAATAIDRCAARFDDRAVRAGVELAEMDAAHLLFEDNTFDCVVSFDAFEHFEEPERVLLEAARVVKKGGYIYIAFGPLYMSPRGLHAWRSINVPYCQLLFPEELLKRYTEENGLEPIDFAQVNRWTLEDYRKLWGCHSRTLKRIVYRENSDPSCLDLVARYPSCFRSKTHRLDNLTVASIGALFKKTG